MWSNECAAGNAGWRLQFRFAVHVLWSRVPELWTLGRAASMKQFLKIAGIVSIVDLLCFWISYGMASVVAKLLLGIYGFDDPPTVFGICFKLLIWMATLFGSPGVIMPQDWGHGMHRMVLLAFSSVVNAVIWGVCFGFLVYSVTKRFRKSRPNTARGCVKSLAE